MNRDYQILHANWQDHRDQLSRVRHQVFIVEQRVPEEMEWDEFDELSQHILILDKHQQPIATGRIKPDGQIGRMAVLQAHRNKGLGSAVLKELVNYAQSQYTEIYLHAQITAIPFYEKHGFVVSSEEFMDADIAHKTMIRNLSSQ